MVMREIEDPFGLKMDVWADEVIDEAILSRGTVAHNHLVGLTGRCTVFSNPFKRQVKMDVWADEVIDEAILSWDCGAQSLGRSHRSVYRLLQPVQASGSVRRQFPDR